jgi:HAD superfamily hydrolase (TIGR01484 family)
MKRLIAFDLDGTLAQSKQAVDRETATLLKALLDLTSVAIISGGDWQQFEIQVVARLPADAKLSRLFILPTTGTKLYRFVDGGWCRLYADLLGDDEKTAIRDALAAVIEQIDLPTTHVWGEQVEDRGSQITFSGLGQRAPLDAKQKWDPDRSKREKLQMLLQEALPNLSIKIAGSTSIDITQPGIDKAYGLRKLSEYANVALDDMLFLGDAIFPGGNDYPAKEMGLDTVRVRDVQETNAIISAVTLWFSP